MAAARNRGICSSRSVQAVYRDRQTLDGNESTEQCGITRAAPSGASSPDSAQSRVSLCATMMKWRSIITLNADEHVHPRASSVRFLSSPPTTALLQHRSPAASWRCIYRIGGLACALLLAAVSAAQCSWYRYAKRGPSVGCATAKPCSPARNRPTSIAPVGGRSR